MPDIIFPKGKILEKEGQTDRRNTCKTKINIEKNIIPFCFSHLSHLSQGRKQATVTAITYITS